MRETSQDLLHPNKLGSGADHVAFALGSYYKRKWCFGGFRCLWLRTLLQSSMWRNFASNRQKWPKFRHIKLKKFLTVYYKRRQCFLNLKMDIFRFSQLYSSSSSSSSSLRRQCKHSVHKSSHKKYVNLRSGSLTLSNSTL